MKNRKRKLTSKILSAGSMVFLVLQILAGTVLLYPQEALATSTITQTTDDLKARISDTISAFLNPSSPESAPETVTGETQASQIRDSGNEETQGQNWVRDFLKQNPEYADMEITDRAESSITFKNKEGKLITQVTGFPIHYQDENGQWQEIDTTLIYYPETDEYGTPWSETRIKPDGTVRIIDDDKNTIHSQKSTSAGIFNETTKIFSANSILPNGTALGDSLIRNTNNFTHRIAVITSFKPGTVYYFQVKSIDQADNEALSSDFALLTPKRKENIVQIIISNFQEIFGWARF